MSEIHFNKYEHVNLYIDGPIGIIEFNYKKKLNALSKCFIDNILGALEDFNTHEIRCVILRAQRGAKVFSAGHDIKELPSGMRDPLSYDDPLRKITRALQKFPKPVISMVEGSVWGGAFEVIMSSDIVVSSNTSTFAFTPVNLSVPYNMVGIHNLMRDTSMHFIKEMIFTAETITAERAHQAGIVNYIAPIDELEATTMKIANIIAKKAPMAIAIIKEELRILGEANTMNSDEFERVQGMRRAVYDSADYQEGMAAFLEKREPKFIGR